MRKVKTFLHVFENSLFPATLYYQKILRTPFNFSFKYFISLVVLLNLIFLFSLGLRFHPQKISTVLTSLTSSLEKYPDDLTITIKNGLAISSYNRPYFLWLDYQNKKKLLLVVDENASPQKIQIYKPLLLLTSRELVLNLNQLKNNQSLSVLPLTYFSDQTITKQEVSRMTNFLTSLIRVFFLLYLAIAIVIIIAIPSFSLLITLFYLTLATVVVVGIYKFIFKKRTHFKKTFQIGLHAVTLPLLLDYFLIVFRPGVNLTIYLPLSEFLFPVSFLILLSVFIFAGTYVAHSPKDGKI